MANARMLPIALLGTLDALQLEALLVSYETAVTQLRVRLEAARYQAQQKSDMDTRAAFARAARTHNKNERALIIWKFARRGLRNIDIAARLGVSTRTVERALARLPDYTRPNKTDDNGKGEP